MGSFDTYTYTGGTWTDQDAAEAHLREKNTPFLNVSIHDSDIATVTYAPGPGGVGLVYLGFQPRDYFENPDASDDVDLDAQADGLSDWARTVVATQVTPDVIRPLLAEDNVDEPIDDFVEDTVARLLETLSLPLPDELQGAE